MKTQTDKTQEPQHSITPRVASESSNGGTAQLKDNRTSSISQRKLRSGMDSMDNSNNPIQRKTSPKRSRRNKTGLPDNLKSGIENLSGYSMDDVKVHYNSSKPAQLQAHAYAQGTDIHLAPGQEKHLPHEAWHVVQQKQGRVKPTRQLKSKVNINDDARLEKEADVMGSRALNSILDNSFRMTRNIETVHQTNNVFQAKLKKLSSDKLNVIGEDHKKSGERRKEEKDYCSPITGNNYWLENEFMIPKGRDGALISADPTELRVEYRVRLILDTVKKELDKNPTTWKEKASALFNIYTDIKKESITTLKNDTVRTYGHDYPSTVHRGTDYNMRDNHIFRLTRTIVVLLKAWEKCSDIFFEIELGGAAEQADIKKVEETYTLTEMLFPVLDEKIPQGRARSKERSMFMHQAANEYRNRQGVWKIGNNHVKDIRSEFIQENINYNLISKDEFGEMLLRRRDAFSGGIEFDNL